MLWTIWQVVLGTVFLGVTVAVFILVVTKRLPQEPRGWVWGYFKARGLNNPSPNEVFALGVMMALVGLAQGLGSVVMWLGVLCGVVMFVASIVRAWQLR